jgi:hypothetical protein
MTCVSFSIQTIVTLILPTLYITICVTK